MRINSLLRDMKYCFPDFLSPDLGKHMRSLAKLLTWCRYDQGLSRYKWKIHTCSQETNADSSYGIWVGWKLSFTLWVKQTKKSPQNKKELYKTGFRKKSEEEIWLMIEQKINPKLRSTFLSQFPDYKFCLQNSKQNVFL